MAWRSKSKLRANAIKHGYRRWVLEDRKKHLLIKKQKPELDIRMVFQSANTKIRKGSKTTYGMFCDKHDIPWAEKVIPESWLNEKKSLSKG